MYFCTLERTRLAASPRCQIVIVIKVRKSDQRISKKHLKSVCMFSAKFRYVTVFSYIFILGGTDLFIRLKKYGGTAQYSTVNTTTLPQQYPHV